MRACTGRYTNGVVAPNRVRTITGPLTGEVIKLPDVDSGYPKSFRGPVTLVEDGQLREHQREEEWFDRGEKGQPDFLEWKRKVPAHMCSAAPFSFGPISLNTASQLSCYSCVVSPRSGSVGDSAVLLLRTFHL